MIDKLFAKYFDDLTVADINDLLKVLNYNQEIVDFVDINNICSNLSNFTEKLCIKEDGDYLNIKFGFFEPTHEDLQHMALKLFVADSMVKKHQMNENLEISDIESILIIKEPITEKHNTRISVFGEEYTIPIFSLVKLYNKVMDNKKIEKKLFKLKNMGVDEYLIDLFSNLNKDEINGILKLLGTNIRLDELFELHFDGFIVGRTKNNDYLNIIVRYEALNDEFMEDAIKISKKIHKELNINKELFTFLLLVKDGADSNMEYSLDNLNLSDDVFIKEFDKVSDFIDVDDIGDETLVRENIEDLKLSFGDVLDEVTNINSIFLLLDKDIEIKVFLDFKFDNDDELTSHKVGMGNNHRLLNLVLYFGEFSDELLKQEAENARKISKELNNSIPIKTYVILIADYVDEKIQYVDCDDDGIYEVEFCSMYDADVNKHLNRLLNEACE